MIVVVRHLDILLARGGELRIGLLQRAKDADDLTVRQVAERGHKERDDGAARAAAFGKEADGVTGQFQSAG